MPQSAPHSVRKNARFIGASSLFACVLWFQAALALMILPDVPGADRFFERPHFESAEASDADWAWREIRQGRMPLWNPYETGGRPLHPSQNFRPYYPGSWFSAALPIGAARSIEYLLHLFLAGAVFGSCARWLRLSWFAAIVGSLSWMLIGSFFVASRPEALSAFEATVYLPLISAGAVGLAAGNTKPAVRASVVGFSLQILIGAYSILLISLYSWTFLFIFARLATGSNNFFVRKSDASLRPTSGIAKIALFVIGLTAIAWIPATEFFFHSTLAAGFSPEQIGAGTLDLARIWEWLLPISIEQGSAGGAATATFARANFYAGAGAATFAAFGLIARSGRRAMVAGFLVLAAAIWVLALGGISEPIRGVLFGFVPGMASVPTPAHFALPALFALIFAATIGVDDFLHIKEDNATAQEDDDAEAARTASLRSRGSWFLTIFVVAVGAALYYQALFFERQGASPGSAAFPADILGPLHLLLSLAVITCLAGLWAFTGHMPSSLQGRTFLMNVLLVGLAVAWLADLVRTNPLGSGDALDSRGPIPTNVLAASLNSGADELGLGDEQLADRYPLRIYSPDVPISVAASHRIYSLYSCGEFQPVALKIYADLRERLGPLHPNFLRLFAVQALLLSQAEFEEAANIQAEFEPAGRFGTNQLYLRKEPIYVRQILSKLPIQGRANALTAMEDVNYNVLEATLALDRPINEGWDSRPMNLDVQISPTPPGEIAFEYQATLSGTLQIGEPALPGWKVRIDDGDWNAPETPGDIDFLNVKVPPGNHAVQLTYDPASFRLGLYLSLVTFSMLLFRGARNFG